MKMSRIGLSLVMLVGLLSACRGPGSVVGPNKKPTGDVVTIAASFYPIAEIVERLGGHSVNVLNLTPPGTDAHDVELTAQQLQQLQEAKLTFYLGEKFQPSLWKPISTLKSPTFDLLKVTNAMGFTCGTCEPDPHVWLDPANMILMTKKVANEMSVAFPNNATSINSNSTAYISELEGLGKEMDAAFTTCTSQVLATSHWSFNYFARRVGLTPRSLNAINPDGQLSAQQLEKLVRQLQADKVSTIFSEELVSNSLVTTVAKKLGATISTLNPLEGITKADKKVGKNYVSIQRHNISLIAAGLGCS